MSQEPVRFIDTGGLSEFVSPAKPLPVDIQGATLSLDANGVEIKNDTGNPIPVSDAGGSITVDGPLTDAELRATAVPVADGGGSLTVDGKAFRSTATITRPSDTTAYTAGDVVGDTGGSAIISLTSAGPSGGFVLVQSVSLVFSDSVVPAGMGAFRIHMYSASPTAIADNAAFDLVSGDRDTYMGYIDLPAPLDFGSTIYTQTDYPGRLIKLAAASTTLFAEIETRGAYTPVSASTVSLRINTLEAGL